MENELEVLDREAEKIIKDIGIPPCPAILAKLLREMRNEEPDFVKLGNLIGGDVSLAAAMLKTVNSPFYGLRSRVASIRQAITLLGLRNVAQLVTGLLLRDAFPGGTSDQMDEFWESSSAIAEISACLAGEFRCMPMDEAYTFGLFRDAGMLAMMAKYKDYRPVWPGKRTNDGCGVIEFEDKCHGMNHARVGYHLAKTWLLPEEICDAVLWHHDYSAMDPGGIDLCSASTKHIALALAAEEVFVRQTMDVGSPEWEKGGAFALGVLGVDQSELDDAAETVGRDLAAA